ncbi:Sapep family Mn(2+)-dependent dipeptidase [Spiroplasma endosymbiont of Anurida maritima]|uniref:Sapep family Mn(2+)-dependent dipeptidase n=1 Tax=Spiroplasma endosymbiont of Anurida maritima TaxID=2967972 RepID=UPI0036D3002B
MKKVTINTKELIEKYFDQAISSITDIVKIPSVRGEKDGEFPYGKNVNDALHYAINLAKSLGFDTYIDKENKYGFVEYGSGDEIFAILGHLDVVPVGDITKWKTKPFEPQIMDGKLIGRGTFDDKGPTILNLYALKYLKDLKFTPDYKIRLIFGLTEETDWDSIRTYMKKEGHPALGYTPDGEFPVVYAEKGILDMDFFLEGQKFTLIGGEAYNNIADVVEYTGTDVKLIAKKLDEMKIENIINSDTSLTVKGIAAHGSMPHKGVNAGLAALYAIEEASAANRSKLTKFVKDHLWQDFSFSKIFPNISDVSGDLSVNNGIMEIDSKGSRLCMNLRVPVKADKNKTLKTMEKAFAEYGLTIKEMDWEPPIFMDKESPLITNIMDVYREVTGDMKAEPLAIGGGTYARSMPNCVAFGAEFDWENTTMHAYNEHISLDNLKRMFEIYAKAIPLLTIKK